MPGKKLSNAEKNRVKEAIFRVIKDHVATYGHAPLKGDLAAMIGYHPDSNLTMYTDMLQEEGRIYIEPGKSFKTLKIIEKEAGSDMDRDAFEVVEDRAVMRFGAKEAHRLMEKYKDTVHQRGNFFTGADEFFDYIHEWEAAVRRLKRSGVNLAAIPIVGVTKSRGK